MPENVQEYCEKILEVSREIETISSYKDQLTFHIDEIDGQYQNKKFGYLQYKHLTSSVLQGKTEREWSSYYDEQILYLLKRLEYLNSKLFFAMYNDHSFEAVTSAPQKMPKPMIRLRQKLELEKPAVKREIPPKKLRIPPKDLPEIVSPVKEKKRSFFAWLFSLFSFKRHKVRKPEQMPAPLEHKAEKRLEPEELFAPELKVKKPREVKETLIIVEEKPVTFWGRLIALFSRRERKEVKKLKKPAPLPGAPIPEPWQAPKEEAVKEQPVQKEEVTFQSRPSLFGIKPKPVFEKILEEEKKIAAESGQVTLKAPFGLNIFKHLMRTLRNKESPGKKRRNLIEKDMRLRYLRQGTVIDLDRVEHISSKLLKKEAKRVHEILTKERALKLYNPTLIGTIANVTSRDISYILMDLFPDFFRKLYNNMRYSNMKILSNTYINIMVFSTLMMSLLAQVLFPPLFFIQGNTILLTSVKSVLMSLLQMSGHYT